VTLARDEAFDLHARAGENAKYKHGAELHHAQIADGRVRRRKSKLLEEAAIRRALESDA
jgi:hypothetical protein